MFSPYPSQRRRIHPSHDPKLVTKQASKKECDIYEILKQYQRTGILTHVTPHQPRFEDLPEGLDYQQALNQVIEADAAFALLPAAVRDHFHNQPLELLQALHDPAQADQLREFGILRQPPLPPAEQTSPPSQKTAPEP